MCYLILGTTSGVQLRVTLLFFGLFFALTSHAVPAKHEPIIEARTYMFRLGDERFIDLTLDRDATVKIRPWAPQLMETFQIIATLEDGTTMKSGTSPNEEIKIPFRMSGKVKLEIVSESLGIMPVLIIETEPKPNELGPCQPEIRDYFLRWLKQDLNWESIELLNSFREEGGNTFYSDVGKGTKTDTREIRIIGSFQTSIGYVLQIEDTRFSYSDRLPTRYLLFFDHAGQLLKDFAGVFYFKDTDGKIIMSPNLVGPRLPSVEDLTKLDEDGTIIWQTRLYGVVPTPLLDTTASGYVAIPWNTLSHLDTGNTNDIHTPVLDFKTGSKINVDSLLEDAKKCTTKDASAICVNSKALALSNFKKFWSSYILENGYYENEIGEACADWNSFCYRVYLRGWVDLNETQILDVAVGHKRTAGSGIENYTVVFQTNNAAKVAGQFYRTLADGRILISTALAKEFVGYGNTPWYDTQEKLALLSPAGQVLWEKALRGTPAYLKGTSTGELSDGVLLSGDRLLWMASGGRNSYSIYNDWIDLKNGNDLAPPPLRVSEGLCK